jgi:hypothetical protein
MDPPITARQGVAISRPVDPFPQEQLEIGGQRFVLTDRGAYLLVNADRKWPRG